MFQFAQPEYLALLWLVPVVLLLFVFSQWQVRKRQQRLGDYALLQSLTPLRSPLRLYLKFVLSLCVLILLIFTVARPQRLNDKSPSKRKGIETMFLLDVSQSMLAQDVSPSRLEKSKLLITSFLQQMSNDKIGLGIFAGDAYPLLPLTNDMVSAQLFINRISCDMVSLQGTNLAAALQLGMKSFSSQPKVGKALILITDGENHEAGAKEAAEEAAKKGCKLFVLGIGENSGAEIPTPQGPLRDQTGQIVRTALNETACKELAQAGQGVYIHVNNSDEAQQYLTQQLQQLQSVSSVVQNNNHATELFLWPALLALGILILEFLLFEKRNPWLKLPHILHFSSTNGKPNA